jgi:drug/metabolite transporter (DMT)-like permease
MRSVQPITGFLQLIVLGAIWGASFLFMRLSVNDFGPVPLVEMRLALGALGVFCTGIAFAMFYRLIERFGANRASIVTYLVPLFGVAWGWLFLDEPITRTMVIACALILGSVAFSQNWSRGAARSTDDCHPDHPAGTR